MEAQESLDIILNSKGELHGHHVSRKKVPRSNEQELVPGDHIRLSSKEARLMTELDVVTSIQTMNTGKQS